MFVKNKNVKKIKNVIRIVSLASDARTQECTHKHAHTQISKKKKKSKFCLSLTMGWDIRQRTNMVSVAIIVEGKVISPMPMPELTPYTLMWVEEHSRAW